MSSALPPSAVLPPAQKRAGWLSRVSVEQLVRVSCIASLVSMGLMSWSVLDPTPFPVIISMSVGQVIGTLALLCYCAAVLLAQVRRSQGDREVRQLEKGKATPAAKPSQAESSEPRDLL